MGTHYKGSKRETTALNTFIKIIRAAESVSSRVNLELAKSNLTESQYYILDTLLHLGPLSQKELGAKIFRSGGNITMVIDNLEKRGLVIRERGKKDRRFFTIYLTKEGNALIEKVFPKQLKNIVSEMEVLSETEQVEFQRLLKLIGLKKKKE
jgi:MarR family 2-MHQ and catechol resistance regulon transcriptional repressor